jgi:hypothetical protein
MNACPEFYRGHAVKAAPKFPDRSTPLAKVGDLGRHGLAWATMCLGLGLARLSAVDVEHFYCGSGMATEKAIAAAQLIVVGSVVKYGTIEAEGPMVHSMTEVEIKVDKALFGDAADHLTVTLRVHAPSKVYPKGESDPQLNAPYLFFVKKTAKDGCEVLKMIDTNDDVARKVGDMITASGKK